MSLAMPREMLRGGTVIGAAALALLATGCHMNQPNSPASSTSPA